MNRALLLIIIVLLLRILSDNSGMRGNSLLNTPKNKVNKVEAFNSQCSQLTSEQQEEEIIKASINRWAKKTVIRSTPMVETNCLNISQHQDLLYSQLKIVKPRYQVKKQIVIAIIDTGIDYNNPNLSERIFRPEGWDLPLDFKGFDLVHQDFFPMDKEGHGTHVSGIIAGLFPEAKILPIKFYESSQVRASLGEAIKIAVHMGAHIINISGGGYGEDPLEEEAIQFAKEKGVLIVSAAGNDTKNMNNSGNEYFPAAYNSDNILSVMANDDNGFIAPYSNFGTKHTDTSALGTIYSYLPSSVSPTCNGFMSGTSQATPVITATAAMLWASYPDLKYTEVKDLVLKGADKSILLIAANKSQGTVNIDRTISGQMQK